MARGLSRWLLRNTPPDADRMILWEVMRQIDRERVHVPVAEAYPAAVAAGLVMYYPFRGTRSITQGYHANHPCIDWAMPDNTPLYATVAGQVVQAGYRDRYYAYSVGIKSDALGVMAICAHMPAGGVAVRVGQWVAAGEYIGKSDNTGNSTGPHLHFDTRRPPYRYGYDTFNPLPYLRAHGSTTPPPVPGGYPAYYRVVKPGNLSVYASPSRTSKVVGHVSQGWVIRIGHDVAERRGANEDWVYIDHQGHRGNVLRQIGGKVYLVRVRDA